MTAQPPQSILRREGWLLVVLAGSLLLLTLAYRLPRQATLSAAFPPAALPQQGMHQVERLGDRPDGLPFRWSEGQATLALPNPGQGPLLLRALIAAPPAGRAVPLRLSSPVQTLPPFTVTAALRWYSLVLPPEPGSERVYLSLETNSFKEDLGRRKERRLGIILSTLEVRSPQGAWPPRELVLALLASEFGLYAALRRAGWASRRAALLLLLLAAGLALGQALWAWRWALSGRLLWAVALAAFVALALDTALPLLWQQNVERLSAERRATAHHPAAQQFRIGSALLLVAISVLALIPRLLFIAAPDPVGDLELSARRTTLLATEGLAGAFSGGGDYLPLRLYLLLGLGHLARSLNLSLGSPFSPPASLLMKSPWLLADLALILIIYRQALRSRQNNQVARNAALHTAKAASASGRDAHGSAFSALRSALCVLLYALAPQIWLNPAWWGQIDALLMLVLVLAVLGLGRARPFWSWALLALALLIKMQAVIMLPLLALASLRRWGLRGLLAGGALLAALLALGMLPLILAGQTPDLIEAYLGSVGRFNGVGINAWNIWYLVAPGVYVPDTDTALLGLSYRQVGLLLLGAATLLIGLLALRRDDPERWVEAAAVQALAFFLLPTQIHERYLYLCFAFLALCIPRAPRLVLPFVVLSISASLNIFASLDFWPAARVALALPWLGPLFVGVNLLVFAALLLHLARPVNASTSLTPDP